MPGNGQKALKPAWQRIGTWFAGLVLLSGLVLVVSHLGELRHFVNLLRQAEPAWLLLVLLLQAATYTSVATVWNLALRKAGLHHSIISLIPVSVAKLFSDQAMPSGGMSGTAFFITALNRRGVPAHTCMAIMLLSLVAFYGAYLLAAVLTVLLLWFYHAINTWVITVVVVFCLVAVGIPAGALSLRSLGRKQLPPVLLRFSGLGHLRDMIANAPEELLRSHALVIVSIMLHGSVFVLDAASLWVMLQMVGVHLSFWAVFPGFLMASMVATVSPIPLGLGTFEVTCVSMLGMLGVPIGAALTATILLRGFTLWLPMLPGMWLVRHALR
jgi:uncharacterized protein (TIRG00374 family)